MNMKGSLVKGIAEGAPFQGYYGIVEGITEPARVGSTLVAAKRGGWKYVEIANRRLEQ